jgi:hypothetical protein
MIPLWQGEIGDEKSLRIEAVQCGGSRTSAFICEAADVTGYPQILVKRLFYLAAWLWEIYR